MSNLVANAVRHTASGQTVRLIGSRAEDGHICVEVVDGCGGIPEESLGRVFDVGWRGEGSRSADDGAGLGLAIARRCGVSRWSDRGAQCDRWLSVRGRAARTRPAGHPGVTLLLTGGAGFIGTVVRRRLIMDGVRVRVFDIAQDRRDDVCDLDRVRAAIQGCDVLVHLTPRSDSASTSPISTTTRHNDLGTAVMLRAAAEAGVRRVVYASSMVVYGEAPIDVRAMARSDPPYDGWPTWMRVASIRAVRSAGHHRPDADH